ncbi:MAG: YbaB/EbfC family nucleoid-associated protein [Syntrophomonadaceae bacterium]|nr:YbaB/EbfC family nucleoid-associated protein [Syntrophomonadaceae bacterium]
MGFGGMGNLSKMMKQAQKMQQEMARMQEELKDKEVEASAGGGAVTVKVTGKQELISIAISPEVVDADDIEMLQDLVLAAVNEGLNQSRELAKQEMLKITGGIEIPGL